MDGLVKQTELAKVLTPPHQPALVRRRHSQQPLNQEAPPGENGAAGKQAAQCEALGVLTRSYVARRIPVYGYWNGLIRV